MLGWGTGVSNARGAEMDPVSAMGCGRVVAGIPKRGVKEMLPARSCIGYISTQWSSNGQALRVVEYSSAKAWHFCSSSATASQCCLSGPVAGQQLCLHVMPQLWLAILQLWQARHHYSMQPIPPLSPAPCSSNLWML